MNCVCGWKRNLCKFKARVIFRIGIENKNQKECQGKKGNTLDLSNKNLFFHIFYSTIYCYLPQSVVNFFSMAYQRAERVGRLIQQNLSKIIQLKLNDPRIGFVTITKVKMSKDLSYATIFIIGENEKTSKKSLRALSNAKKIIRKMLAENLYLRKVPEIMFKLDDAVNEFQQIEALFEKIKTTKI